MNKKELLITPWLTKALNKKPVNKGVKGTLFLNPKTTMDLSKDLKSTIPEWQMARLSSPNPICAFETMNGPLWLVSPNLAPAKKSALKPLLYVEPNSFARLRDAAGLALQQAFKANVDHLHLKNFKKNEDLIAALHGFELAQYKFKVANERKELHLHLGSAANKSVAAAETLGFSINIARHLVNLPPNMLFPKSFAGFAQDLFKGLRVNVEVWDKAKLRKENMNLHLAVGQGSINEPCLVRLKYLPQKRKRTIALVGKGVTFDSGGLDIKPSSGMRLMKKDMGGAAAVLGATYWAAKSGLPIGLDVYIPLAENSVGQNSFRPSDVYTSRSGQTVEIHNTDAEGRLVLADAIDLALENAPEALINVATLTGAIKTSLGVAMPGLFSNHLPLCAEIQKSFWQMGDPAWPMPLVQKYRSQMSSNFADFTNAVDGFGGAVTAALFLQSFVNDTPWAHLDIYAWKDGADGAWSEGGGSGQAVAGLAGFLANSV